MPLRHHWGNRNIKDGRRRPEKYSNNHYFITNGSRNVFAMPSYGISHPRNMFNYVSMAYDVSKMAVKMAATNMENIEMAITSLFKCLIKFAMHFLSTCRFCPTKN